MDIFRVRICKWRMSGFKDRIYLVFMLYYLYRYYDWFTTEELIRIKSFLKIRTVAGLFEMFGEMMINDSYDDFCKRVFKEVSVLEKYWLADRKRLRELEVELNKL